MKHLSIRSGLIRTASLLCFPLWAEWIPLGPFGGSASVVVADPHYSRTLVAGTRNALLFRSRDGGESWTQLAFPAQLHATLNAFAIDPQTAGIYLAGVSSESPQYSGILRSVDAGATWRQIPDLRNHRVRAIAFKRASSKIVAAGTDSGVFLSQDGGIGWTRVSPEDNRQLQPIVSLAFDPKDGATLYAGTPHLPWKTSDGGATWHSIHAGMLDDSDVFSIFVDRNRPQRLFAGACSGIYRSLNAGAAWTRLTDARDASYRTYVIAQDPQYENVWFAGTTHGMVRSLDGGATWEKIGSFATRSIAFDPGRLGRIFIAADEAGILRSDDNGKTWQPVNYGFYNRQLSSLWTVGGAVYTATLDGVARGNIFRLAPDRAAWEDVTSALLNVLPAALSPPSFPNLVLAKFESGLFISEDDGANWKILGLPLDAPDILTVTALDTPWTAAVGPSGVFLSRDARSWKLCSPPGGEVYDVISTRGGRLLAATSSGLKASNDLGASWDPVRGELETDTVKAICRHPRRPALLFAAKYGIIYGSVDAGRSWRRISSEAWPILSVKQLALLPGTPDRLLALTHQQGVWELLLDAAPPSVLAER